MAERGPPKPESQTAVPPGEMPQTTTPGYPGADYSFVLQTVIELQKSVGGLEQCVIMLTNEIKEQRKTINRINFTLWFATGAVVVGGAVVSFFFPFLLRSGFNQVLEAIKALP